MSIAYVLFDLDDTLYPPGRGLMQAISARITRYLVEHLHLTEAEANALRFDYYARYGSSVYPLAMHHHLDLAEFLAFAHDVDVESYLATDADLACLLDCVTLPKVLFTNGTRAYVQRVLRCLSIEQNFARIFDCEFGNYVGKPDAAIYRKVQAALNVPSDALVMVDDTARNLVPARALGWKTIYVNAGAHAPTSDADFVAYDLWQIAVAFQQLGVMDATHRSIAEHRLAGCVWAQRRAQFSEMMLERLK